MNVVPLVAKLHRRGTNLEDLSIGFLRYDLGPSERREAARLLLVSYRKALRYCIEFKRSLPTITYDIEGP